MFHAKFKGRCWDCKDPISVGDKVEFDRQDHIIHLICDERLADEPETEWVGETCTSCWLVKSVNGACGC